METSQKTQINTSSIAASLHLKAKTKSVPMSREVSDQKQTPLNSAEKS